MALLNKTGITDGSTIQSEHVTRTIDALTGVSTDSIVATGSFSGTLTGTSSFATTASYALNAGAGASEYMTLRLESGVITGVTSAQAIYIGTNVTSSSSARAGVRLPYGCTIVSASIYSNSPISTNANLGTVQLYNDILGATTPIANFSTLDVKTVYIDGSSVAVGVTGQVGKWINVGFTPNNTSTGLFVVSADILIKKL